MSPLVSGAAPSVCDEDGDLDEHCCRDYANAAKSGRLQMSLSNAEAYALRARNADNVSGLVAWPLGGKSPVLRLKNSLNARRGLGPGRVDFFVLRL